MYALGNGITGVLFLCMVELACDLFVRLWLWLYQFNRKLFFSKFDFFWLKFTTPGLLSSYLDLGLNQPLQLEEAQGMIVVRSVPDVLQTLSIMYFLLCISKHLVFCNHYLWIGMIHFLNVNKLLHLNLLRNY